MSDGATKVSSLSLKRRLAWGIFLFLLVILAFFLLTSVLYREMEHFVAVSLRRQIVAARTYERLIEEWTAIAEQIATRLQHSSPPTVPLVPVATTETFKGTLKELLEFVCNTDRQGAFQEIQNLARLYLTELRGFERTLARRSDIEIAENQRRAKAVQSITREIDELLTNFQEMLEDFNRTLRKPDFQSSTGATSALMSKVTRIEKDLAMAQTEVALYLSQERKNSGRSPVKMTGREITAERIQSRLQAVISLLEQSGAKSQSPIHQRVLGGISIRVRELLIQFRSLRDVLEQRGLEHLEIVDATGAQQNKLAEIRSKGIVIARQEAEYYWSEVTCTAQAIQHRFKRDFRLSLAFLGVALGLGIYFLIVFPRRLGDPLSQLQQQVKAFRLGSDIPMLKEPGSAEIRDLAQAFEHMATRMNAQNDLSLNYLKTLHKVDEVYRELQDYGGPNPEKFSERLERAINIILQELLQTVETVDLVKIMRTVNVPGTDQPAGFVRVGEPFFSHRFQNSDEYAVYCASTNWSMLTANSEDSGENLSIDASGLTNWLFENYSDMRVIETREAQPHYHVLSIGKNPIFRNRTHEQGLSGSVHIQRLFSQVADNAATHEETMPLGLLFVYFLDPDIRLSWQDLFFIDIMATQIARTIAMAELMETRDKKRKMDAQLELARDIQENLLPQEVPQVPGLIISKACQSAAEVGGDYFDFFRLDDDRLGIVVADAAGKNVPAAILTTIFKTALFTMDLKSMTPGQVLRTANRIVSSNITSDRFITAIYVIIHAGTGRLELASAGHNPALLVSGHGSKLKIEELLLPGLPLGIMDIEYQSMTTIMPPASILLLYTDGVTEARSESREEYGVSMLRRFLTRFQNSADYARPAQLQSLAPALLADVATFAAGAEQHDDITAVSVQNMRLQ